MSRWFRFYADALRNPKVMRLSDKEFRLWVRLMAVASENDGKIPCLDDLKHVLSMRLDHLSSGVDRLISGSLIDVLDDGYEPHHWSKFQYKSDSSTDRVTKHRAKRNVSETPPDTETEEEAESPPTPRAGGRRGKHALSSDWVLPSVAVLPPKARACAEQWTAASYETHGEAFVSYWRGNGKMMVDWDGTWANRIIALHSQVMRDQKFGNAPIAESATPRQAMTTEAQQAYLATLDSDAKPWMRRGEITPPAPRKGTTGPPRPIGDLITNIAGAAR